MTKTKLIVALFVIFTFLFLTIVATGIVQHEETHKAICESFGGNATIRYSYDGGSSRCFATENKANIHFLDSINEIISYNLMVLVLTLFACTMTICLMMFILKGEKGE